MNFQSLDLIKDLVKCLCGMDVRVIQGKAGVLQTLHEAIAPIPLPMVDQELDKGLAQLQSHCVYEVSGVLELRFLIIFDDGTERYLFAGPCVLEPQNEADLRAELRDMGANAKVQNAVLDNCRSVPLVTYETFHQLGALLIRAFLDIDVPLPHQRLDYQWLYSGSQVQLFTDQFADLSQMRRVELRYEHSAALTEAVKQGNLSLAYRFLHEMEGEGDSLVRNPNPLRNRQNMCIILNTQLRYALEASGVHPYLLDHISSDVAVRIEKLHSLEEANRLATDTIRRYCELAQTHALPDLDPLTHLAVTYIKAHLAETLTVKETAKALLVSPNYLSTHFHQAIGMTFIDYVNLQRTTQAAALLKQTTLQIQQIATFVGYNNTSYFAKQFIKTHGMSPRDYRNKGQL